MATETRFCMILFFVLFFGIGTVSVHSAIGKNIDSAREKPRDTYLSRRLALVNKLAKRGISNEGVLEAMREVPRHHFVAPGLASKAYEFGNLPIGHGQVIGDPYIVAFMTQAISPGPNDRILEIGTGSGYQAAILAKLAKEVYSVEVVAGLAKSAKLRLRNLGYENVRTKCGDGFQGWAEMAPFDAVIVTAHPDAVPTRLLEQMKIGAKMVVPVGGKIQRMQLVTKLKQGFRTENLQLPGLQLK